MTKHIVFLCNEYPPNAHGGIGIFVKNLAENLVKLNFKCTVIGHYPIKQDLTEEINGVKVIQVRETRGKFWNLNIISRVAKVVLNKYRLTKRLKQYEKEESIDLIEGYEWNGPLISKPCTKMVVRLHGSNTAHAVFEKKKTSKLLRYFEKKNLDIADDIVSVSQHLLEITQKTFGQFKVPSSVIYNSYNSELFFANKEFVRDEKKILFVGKFHIRKGVFELFDILESVLRADSFISFHFVGAHNDENANLLLKQISPQFHSNIMFTNAVPQNDLPHLYNESSLMIMPSRAEAFGLTAIEAMACGCVVAMADLPVAKELIEDNVDGLIINTFNSTESAARIIGLLNEKHRLNDMSIAAVNKVLSKFSSAQILKENIRYYERFT